MKAGLKCLKEHLASPASRIVACLAKDVGTGCMELIQQLELQGEHHGPNPDQSRYHRAQNVIGALASML